LSYLNNRHGFLDAIKKTSSNLGFKLLLAILCCPEEEEDALAILSKGVIKVLGLLGFSF